MPLTAKTVLGEVPQNQLGRTLCHEHMILTWNAAKDDLPDLYSVEKLSNQVVANAGKAIRDHQIKTFVDVSPSQLGRDVELHQVIARKLNVNIIAATGFYRQRSGIADYWLYQEEDQYEEYMVREITQGVSGGINNQKVKCGVIKIAWSSDFSGDPEPGELKATHAAARASKRTGCPIVAHCPWRANPGRNLGLEQVKMMVENGADPERIQISHCHSTRGNLAYLLEVVKTGAYVALPDAPIFAAYSDKEYVETVVGLIGGVVRAGYGDKVVMATDGQGTWFPEIPPGPAKDWTPVGHWNYVYETYLPLLRAGGLTERELEKIMVENPARLFSW